jgi:hypothetical protein
LLAAALRVCLLQLVGQLLLLMLHAVMRLDQAILLLLDSLLPLVKTQLLSLNLQI